MRLHGRSNRLKWIHFLLALSVFFLCRPGGVAEAQKRDGPTAEEADFSQSVMIGPKQEVREGDTVEYEIILHNPPT